MNEGGDDARLVEVRFVTKLPPSLKVPTTSMKLPSKLTRAGLSEIVNYLLLSGNDFSHLYFHNLILKVDCFSHFFCIA